MSCFCFRHGVFAILLPLISFAQMLDWSGDMTLFGTDEDERSPQIVFRPASEVVHAFCVRSDSIVDCKVSRNRGVAWSPVTSHAMPATSLKIVAAADGDYTFATVIDGELPILRVYRFAGYEQDWSSAVVCDLSDESSTILGTAIFSDFFVQPDDPYLNLLWSEQTSGLSNTRLMFTQSRNRGMSFGPARCIISFDRLDGGGEVDAAVAWNGDQEDLIVAASVDRAGTIPEGVFVFRSSDDGETWSLPLLLDSVAYPQVQPTIAAHGSLVLVAYSRRSSVAEQKDIYFTYSPDAGLNFAPVVTLTDSIANEHSPCLAVSEDGNTFVLSYFSGRVVDEEGAIFAREGSVATPWMMSEPYLISEVGGATDVSQPAIVPGTRGFSAVWTNRFALGDNDVMFDASWRGLQVLPTIAPLADAAHLLSVFPNPLNSLARLSLQLNQTQSVSLRLWNATGQAVMMHNLGVLSPGVHEMTLDMTLCSSGVYFVGIAGGREPTKFVLAR